MTDYSKEEITALEDVFPGNLFMWYNVYIKILIQFEAIPYWIKILFHFIVPSCHEVYIHYSANKKVIKGRT